MEYFLHLASEAATASVWVGCWPDCRTSVTARSESMSLYQSQRRYSPAEHVVTAQAASSRSLPGWLAALAWPLSRDLSTTTQTLPDRQPQRRATLRHRPIGHSEVKDSPPHSSGATSASVRECPLVARRVCGAVLPFAVLEVGWLHQNAGAVLTGSSTVSAHVV
jgi:hypothetical protein